MSYTQHQIAQACKSKGVDPKPIIEELKKNAKKKECRPFWQSFLSTWEEFYLKERSQKYIFTGRDIAQMGELYDLIKKKCDIACFEWNEDCVCRSFSAVLKRAMSHSEFIKKDFRPLHLVNQFNSITSNNGKQSTTDYKSNLAARING